LNFKYKYLRSIQYLNTYTQKLYNTGGSQYLIRGVIQINTVPITQVTSTLSLNIDAPMIMFPWTSVNIIILWNGNVKHYNTWFGTERSFHTSPFTTAGHKLITKRLFPLSLVVPVSVFLILLNRIHVLFYIFDFAKHRLMINFIPCFSKKTRATYHRPSHDCIKYNVKLLLPCKTLLTNP